MRRTILIPTDYTVESLNLVKAALSKRSNGKKYDIILIHGIFLSSSITELLFLSKDKIIESLSNPEFDEACEVLRNKFDSQINSLRKDFFSGSWQSAFNNYVEGNRIDEAFIPSNHSLKRTSKKSFDIIPYIKKSDIPVNEVDWNSSHAIPEKGRLAEIFSNNFSSR